MQHLFTVVLTAAAVSAQYSTIKVVENEIDARDLYFRTDDMLPVNNGAWISVDNFLTLKEKKEEGSAYMYKPRLNGGAFQYTIKLNVPCGCVAGVYAVNVDDEANPDVDVDDQKAPN